MNSPAPTTTHTTTAGKPPKRCEIAQRLGWARGVLDDIEIHSDARIRRACKTILNDSRDHAERQLATDLWRMVNDKGEVKK
ncbi:hypothetical protein [Yoonia sp. I 8.24]|uniref:hypothetical protein n=1 Tax=Yoonia sp. I 8.24 TaxID=1537229 RepID=UPI001EDDDB40|nr:hypothetical protein [Yoonia sp. I 8.24]MCG3267753.1 hypothetical protein [Yoonia sp. I 8.24]